MLPGTQTSLKVVGEPSLDRISCRCFAQRSKVLEKMYSSRQIEFSGNRGRYHPAGAIADGVAALCRLGAPHAPPSLKMDRHDFAPQTPACRSSGPPTVSMQVVQGPGSDCPKSGST